MSQSLFPSYFYLTEDPFFRRSLWLVFALHLLFLGFAWLQPTLPKTKTTPKPVVVKTVALSPQPAISVPIAVPKPQGPPKSEPPKPEPPKQVTRTSPPAPVVPKTNSTPKPKSTVTPAKAAVATPPPKPKPAVASSVSTKVPVAAPKPKPPPGPDQALLAEAKEALAKMHQAPTPSPLAPVPAKTSPAIQAPTLTSLSLESLGSSSQTLSAPESSYCAELSSRLKLFLRLPTYGEVKVRLTLKRNGTVVKIEILSAASADNRTYVEKNLPTLQFSPFGQNFAGEEQHAFMLTLTNE